MTALVLPTPTLGYPDTTIRVALDGSTYSFHWLWNTRDGAWSVSIATVDGVAIADGVRVALGVDLLAWVDSDVRPPGRIVVVDPSGGLEDPDLDTLGTRVKIVYLPGST